MEKNKKEIQKIKLNDIKELKNYILTAISDIFDAKIYDNIIEFNELFKFAIEICD